MKPDITEAEMEVLKALWKSGGGTVREVAEALSAKKARAYTTLQTLLKRLEDKGVVAVEKGSVPHVYRAAVSRHGLVKVRLKALAEDLCDGAAGPLVLALVDQRKFSKKELDSFKSLIEKLDREGA